MPELDLGLVVGPQGKQGEPGPRGAQGIQGEPGPAATINGVNALTIVQGENIELTQEGDTLTIGAIKPSLNLLDNSHWEAKEHIINQRGQAAYTGSGYTVDRWRAESYTSAVTPIVELTSNGIKVGMSGAGQSPVQLSQTIENPEAFSNKTVTLSLDVAELAASSAAILLEAALDGSLKYYTAGITAAGITSITTKLDGACRSLRAYLRGLDTRYSDTPASYTVFRAAKLELGSHQTLARQDADGNWVLNDPPPNYVLEQLKCQRYFQIFKTQSLRPTYAEDFRPVMRTNPALGTAAIGGVTYYTATADL